MCICKVTLGHLKNLAVTQSSKIIRQLKHLFRENGFIKLPSPAKQLHNEAKYLAIKFCVVTWLGASGYVLTRLEVTPTDLELWQSGNFLSTKRNYLTS